MNAITDRTTTKTTGSGSHKRSTRLMTLGFLLYLVIILAGHVVGFPLSYNFLHTVCTQNCAGFVPQLTLENVRALSSLNLSIIWYTNFYMVIQVIYILFCLGVALLVVLKKPGELIPLATGFMLVGLSAYEGADYPALTAMYPVLTLPLYILVVAGVGLPGIYVLMTFPNGRFAPRWVFWLFLLSCAVFSVGFVDFVFPFIATNAFLNILLSILGLLTGFPLVLFILIYRYSSVLNARERKATKWVIYSVSVFILLSIVGRTVIAAITPADSLWFLLVNTMGFFGCGINIAGLFMAILYANAFDIDTIINRSLVYGSLTVTLALVYLGLVFGGQTLLTGLIGQDNGVIIVISTLIVAVLFQPLRQWIQRTIDRRFYRQKYDAARALQKFSAILHQEVDLTRLCDQMVSVVQETVQPEQISLWLLKSRRESHSPPEDIS
jgi:hypothetical protein